MSSAVAQHPTAGPKLRCNAVGLILIAASGVMEMARELRSAGAFYTYVTRGLGPRAGFVTGGLMVLLAFEGIRSSLRTALVLFTIEVAIVLGLALIIVGKGGADGLSLHPLNPAASPNGFSGLTTAFVFAALSFVGFEAAATLGDEARAPRSYVPRAILLSVLAVGGLERPRMINSANGIVRILNTMGREGLLPRTLASIDPKRHSPSHAVFATGVFTGVTALTVGAVSGGLGDPAGGSNVYGYLGFLLTLGILPVYVLANLASARYFATAGPNRPRELERAGTLLGSEP